MLVISLCASECTEGVERAVIGWQSPTQTHRSPYLLLRQAFSADTVYFSLRQLFKHLSRKSARKKR